MAARGGRAAKFREETPREGAAAKQEESSNAAPQQYSILQLRNQAQIKVLFCAQLLSKMCFISAL
jgi:hypothetical protein